MGATGEAGLLPVILRRLLRRLPSPRAPGLQPRVGSHQLPQGPPLAATQMPGAGSDTGRGTATRKGAGRAAPRWPLAGQGPVRAQGAPGERPGPSTGSGWRRCLQAQTQVTQVTRGGKSPPLPHRSCCPSPRPGHAWLPAAPPRWQGLAEPAGPCAQRAAHTCPSPNTTRGPEQPSPSPGHLLPEQGQHSSGHHVGTHTRQGGHHPAASG